MGNEKFLPLPLTCHACLAPVLLSPLSFPYWPGQKAVLIGKCHEKKWKERKKEGQLATT